MAKTESAKTKHQSEKKHCHCQANDPKACTCGEQCDCGASCKCCGSSAAKTHK